MIIAGIDPGLDGAVGIIDGTTGRLVHLFDLPTVEVRHGKDTRRELSPALLHQALVDVPGVEGFAGIDLAVVEQVSASPQMGVTSAFRFGEGYGALIAVLQVCGIRTHLVRPAVWKKDMKLNSEGEISRHAALQLWPDNAGLFTRKKDHNRAEAALLAEWGRKHA